MGCEPEKKTNGAVLVLILRVIIGGGTLNVDFLSTFPQEWAVYNLYDRLSAIVKFVICQLVSLSDQIRFHRSLIIDFFWLRNHEVIGTD